MEILLSGADEKRLSKKLYIKIVILYTISAVVIFSELFVKKFKKPTTVNASIKATPKIQAINTSWISALVASSMDIVDRYT